MNVAANIKNIQILFLERSGKMSNPSNIDIFRELREPDSLIGSNGTVRFWFVGAKYDNDYYLHQDLVVRSGCHDPNSNQMLGHYKTEEDAKKYRAAYYMKYGLGTVGSIVGSEPPKVDNGSRVLDLDN